MESTRSRAAMISKVLRIVYIGVLLAHLLMWALNVKGQPVRQLDEGSNLSGTNSASALNGLFNSHSGKSLEALNPRQRLVRDIYTSQIGVREKQPNSGPEVEKYLRYVNLPKGNPWCAAFVCWVYGEAGITNPRSAWSPDLFRESHIIWPVKAESGKLKAESGSAESMTHKFQGDRPILPSSLATGNWQLAAGNRSPPITATRLNPKNRGCIWPLLPRKTPHCACWIYRRLERSLGNYCRRQYQCSWQQGRRWSV